MMSDIGILGYRTSLSTQEQLCSVAMHTTPLYMQSIIDQLSIISVAEMMYV